MFYLTKLSLRFNKFASKDIARQSVGGEGGGGGGVDTLGMPDASYSANSTHLLITITKNAIKQIK